MNRWFQWRRMSAMVAFVVLLSAPALAAGSASVCQAAGTDAELLHALPPGLLLAIGRVESGRRDPSTGLVAPWPWTINAAGAGHYFDSAPEALGTTRALQAQGMRSIDVGCFQVNLQHHAEAFANLEDAFDPHANADYAARFLVALRTRTGSWEEAVAAYHSATPERGGPYRDRVLAGWARVGGVPAPLPAPALRPNLVMIWTTSAQHGLRVWTPSAPGASPLIILIRSGQDHDLSAHVPQPAAGSVPLPDVHRSLPQPRLSGRL